MGELGALFNPGMRHELEERQAKAARREEEGNAKDGDLRIDLESGVAVINAPGQDSTVSGTVSDEDGADPSPAGDSKSPSAPLPEAADEATESRPAAGKTPARAAPRPVKSARGSGSPEKPALQPRGKRGAPAAR